MSNWSSAGWQVSLKFAIHYRVYPTSLLRRYGHQHEAEPE
jgi:hypothetical protein